MKDAGLRIECILVNAVRAMPWWRNRPGFSCPVVPTMLPSGFAVAESTTLTNLPKEALVVGGGIIGLAIAWQLLRHGIPATVLEKEPGVGRHQSTHNSGVLHAGLYYKPGSLKAKLAVSGIRMMTAFCREHAIPFEICGKLVVATAPEELPRLKELLSRGEQNGLSGLRWVEKEEMHEIEPGVAGIAAVHVPEEGIVDYGKVCETLASEIVRLGGQVITGARVRELTSEGNGWRAESTAGTFTSSYLINAAGLYCDRVFEMAGGEPTTKIIPFRGEYYRLGPRAQQLVKHLIYPVPDPAFPFLGVHFTRLIHGGIEAGPNAVLAFAREGYRMRRFHLPELFESLTFPGLWRFMMEYPGMCAQEFYQSLSKPAFCRALQRLVPGVTVDDLEPGGAGVRAQAIESDGTLLQDFRFGYQKNALHLLNAPSPGATASLAIGEAVLAEIVKTKS